MKKIVRLTESDLVRLVKRLQKKSTSNEINVNPIHRNLDTLQNAVEMATKDPNTNMVELASIIQTQIKLIRAQLQNEKV